MLTVRVEPDVPCTSLNPSDEVRTTTSEPFPSIRRYEKTPAVKCHPPVPPFDRLCGVLAREIRTFSGLIASVTRAPV